MSALIVEVCEISEVLDHPNADRLNINKIKGWTIISNKEEKDGKLEARYKPGDKVVYFPPDSILPDNLIERLEIENYVSRLRKDENGDIPPGGRVRAITLRGEPSYGVLMPVDDPSWEVGKDVKDHYGVKKWEPPVRDTAGDMDSDHPLFSKYTSIENLGNFPNVIEEGEEVVFTEKIHGTNSRIGKIRDKDEDGNDVFVYMAGSHETRRKKDGADGRRSLYWYPLSDDLEDWKDTAIALKKLLDYLCSNESNVQIFGEIYGSGVQDMAYGFKQGSKGFRAFDVLVDGKYLDFGDKMKLFKDFEIPHVPLLYHGPFSLDVVKEHTSGKTTLCSKKQAGEFKGREGIVIVPVVERFDFDLGGSGRVILKSISADYLSRKNPTDSH